MNNYFKMIERHPNHPFDSTIIWVISNAEYSTCDITAESGSDYEAVTSGSIQFQSGATSGVGTVEILDEQTIESTEVFGINIVFNDPSSTGCTGKVIPPSKAYVTIHDSGTSKYYINYETVFNERSNISPCLKGVTFFAMRK